MVASDTLVGLVGAGILLVALAGVFVFESRQTATDLALAPSEHTIQATDGSMVDYTAATGTQPQPGVCLPPGSCTPQQVKAKITLTGAPRLPPQTTLNYVASVTGEGQTLVLGTLTLTGEKYALDSASKTVAANYDTFTVSLETTATPTQPSTLVLYQQTYTAPAPTAGTDVPLDQTATAKWEAGSGTARLASSAGGLAVTIAVDGAGNRTGYQLRAWLHDTTAASLGYVFLGNLSADGRLSVTVTGADLDSFAHLFITLEPSESTPASRSDSTQGVPVYKAEIA